MTDEPTPIAEILSSSTPEPEAPAVTAEATPEPVKETVSEQPRAPDGKFATKQAEVKAPVVEKPSGEVAAPPVAPSQPPHGYVPIAALVDTRLEARQAKQERDEFRRKFEEATKPKDQPVDFFADPETAFKQTLAPFEQRFQQTVSNLTLRASRAEAIAIHGKDAVGQMEKAVGDAIEAGDPEIQNLRAQMLNSDDPVAVAMQWHQRKRIYSEVGDDPAAYREKLKAEILAEMNGQKQTQQPAPVMPSNLAGARNVGTRTGPAWPGPTPLADIFKR